MGADETGLIQQARLGDRAAFSALVAAHRGGVYRFAERLTRDPALAEDVLQETFLAAHQGLAGWRGEGSFRGWLLAIARSRVLMARRRRVGEPAAHEGDDTLAELGLSAGWGAAMDPEALALRTEERGLIERALAQLGEEEREVIVLRDLEGLSGEETAAALGLQVAAMKSRLHRARLRLVAAVKGGLDGRE
jgi:RNA polymerase sigma-70 factor (ECF subfamily)